MTEFELYVIGNPAVPANKASLETLEDSLTLELAVLTPSLEIRRYLSCPSNLEHWSILKIWSFCHNVFVILNC